jgi:hypothetical protein
MILMKPNITQERLKQLLHYNPDTGKFTRLTKWGSQQIGDEPGSISKFGYRYIGVDGKGYTAYRLAWLYMYGDFPVGDIDHINRDPTDDRIANLRSVSHSTNLHNSSHRNPSSKIKGVYRTKENHWQASIKVKGVTYRLGTFKTIEEAADARKFAEQLLIPA